jgi:pimeloyl-ACP methyl ester carboxylesterase
MTVPEINIQHSQEPERTVIGRRKVLRILTALAVPFPVNAMSNKESVVLVHGLWMTGVESGLIRHRLQSDYEFEPRQFSYRTIRDGLDDNVALLRDFIRETPGDVVHVVGHSLGGVLALYTQMQFPESRPGRIVCLGSPLCGSLAARAVAGLPFGLDILGRTIRDAVLSGGLPAYRGARPVGVIAGTLGFGLGLVIEDLPEPNDGAVAMVETRLPGITDHIGIRVSHTGLLISRAVAEQTAWFLRHGRFSRDIPDETEAV